MQDSSIMQMMSDQLELMMKLNTETHQMVKDSNQTREAYLKALDELNQKIKDKKHEIEIMNKGKKKGKGKKLKKKKTEKDIIMEMSSDDASAASPAIKVENV